MFSSLNCKGGFHKFRSIVKFFFQLSLFLSLQHGWSQSQRFISDTGCECFENLIAYLWFLLLENCPIYLGTVENPRTLKCKHVFCSECLQRALAVCYRCPVCQEPQSPLTGNQPPGEMSFRTERFSVPGHEGNQTNSFRDAQFLPKTLPRSGNACYSCHFEIGSFLWSFLILTLFFDQR